MSDPAGLKASRAPGAEHTVRVVKVGVNPRRLLHLDDAGVAAVLAAAAARAIGLTRYRMRPTQRPYSGAPARGSQERIR